MFLIWVFGYTITMKAMIDHDMVDTAYTVLDMPDNAPDFLVPLVLSLVALVFWPVILPALLRRK